MQNIFPPFVFLTNIHSAAYVPEVMSFYSNQYSVGAIKMFSLYSTRKVALVASLTNIRTDSH